MTAQPVRVLVVAPSLERVGGQSVQAARLLSCLREERGVTATFLASDTRLPGPLKAVGGVRYARTGARLPLYVGTLLREIPRHDVVHVFAASYWSFVLGPTPALALGKLFRKQVVVNYHSGEAPDHLRRWPSAVRTLRAADAIVVQSPFLAGAFAQAGLDATVIPNHLDAKMFTFRVRDPLRPRFITTRALESDYGGDVLLRAFAIVQRELPDAELAFVGDGSRRDALEALARELSLRGVTFHGSVATDKMPQLYDDADVFVNASRVDSMPLSILETFASGLPVVTTAAGGVPQLVHDGVTGLVTPVGDPDALAAAALRLFAEPALARSLATNALAECARYSWDANRAAWLALYGGAS